MRESGFDPSNRFGPFSVDIVHHVPVCLNALLYQMEKDAASIARTLGDADAAGRWTKRAEQRRSGSTATSGTRPGSTSTTTSRPARRRHYEFATTFYPALGGPRLAGAGARGC